MTLPGQIPKPSEEKLWEGNECRRCCADYSKNLSALGVATLMHIELKVCRVCRGILENQMEQLIAMSRMSYGGKPLKFEKRG
mgnify:CR=1 FL=1